VNTSNPDVTEYEELEAAQNKNKKATENGRINSKHKLKILQF
jgi:hypothetical protein